MRDTQVVSLGPKRLEQEEVEEEGGAYFQI